jgi:hypothetical protein
MVSRMQVMLLALLAVFVVGVLAAPAAFAAEERPHWVVETKELIEKEKVEYAKVEGGPYKLSAETLPTIECAKQTINTEHKASEDFVEGLFWTQIWLKFSECKVVGSPTCVVPNIVTTRIWDVIVFVSPRLWVDIYWPHGPLEKGKFNGEEFATIHIETCSLKGSFAVTGSTITEPSQKEIGVEEAKPTTTAVSKTGTFEDPATGEKEVAGELKFGTKKATLTGKSTVELVGGKKFGAN